MASPVASSPLRRGCEAFQSWLGLVLSVTVLAGTPLAAALVGDHVRTGLEQTALEQSRTGHFTQAVLL